MTDAFIGRWKLGPAPCLDQSGTPLRLTRIDAATLASAAFASGGRLSFARRRAESDLLATVQEAAPPGRPTTRNIQVYRRR